MKKSCLLWSIVLASTCGSMLGVGNYPCGNGAKAGPAATGHPLPPPPVSGTGNPPGQEPSHPNQAKGDPVVPYTGNEYRDVQDLEIWGGVGQVPLTWSRHSTSRAATNSKLFGTGHYWRHNYQWDLADAGKDTQGRQVVSLSLPDGGMYRFTSTGAGQWTGTVGCPGTLSGDWADGSQMVYRDANGFRYTFVSQASGSQTTAPASFLMRSFLDAQDNRYQLEYQRGLLSKVIEPGGRSLSIAYRTLSDNAATSSQSVFSRQVRWSQLAIPTSNPAAGQWIELPLSSSMAFNYVRVLTADGANANIAEMQFYAAATDTTPERLIASDTATLISSGSLNAAQNATDGVSDSVFESITPSGAWIGWAFKSATKLSRVRVLVKAGTETSVRPSGNGMQPMKIQGGMAQASSARAITVISSVSTSSGRRVDYEYQNFRDQLNQYPVLTGALYGDATRSTYKYTQVADGTRPMVEEFDDVRYGLPMAHSKTVYQNILTGGIFGMVSKQINPLTGNPILTLGVESGKLHSPTVTYSNGGVETQYMNEGNMTSQSDANKNTISYTYDAGGFLASTTDALGNKTSYTRTPLGNLLTQTNPDGGVEAWTRNALEAVTSYTDALGRVTTWTRDTHNRVTRIDYPDGSNEEFLYNEFAQPVQHRTRNGQIENFAYDARGLLLFKTDPLGNTITLSYDAFDRLSAVTDQLGRTTGMEYNERGLVTRMLLPDGSFTATTYNALGDVVSETNELGATWTYGSDIFRRVVTTTDPLGRTTTITYPADSPEKTPLALSTPSGRTVSYEYDLAWNKIAETLAPHTSEAARTKFTYDKANRIVSVQDPLGKITKATYDKRGRVLTHTDALARVTAFQYDLAGNAVTKTRPDKAMEKTSYDALNRVLSSTDAAGGTTVYSYDLGGTLHGLTDARGNAFVYAYDALNRKVRMTYPDGSHEDWEYDAVGNNLTYTTRGGQQLGSVFDARNRVTSSVWSDGTPSVTRTYDAAGRLLSTKNSVSALTYTYDAANQLLSETQCVAAEGVAHTVLYSYDLDRNRSRMVAPSGMALDYAYTARNQVAEVSADGPPPIATYAYDLNGNRIQRTLENGFVTKFTYDPARQLLSVDHSTAAGSLVRLDYAYDDLGNRTSLKWEDGRVDRYGYDPLSQLIQAQYASLAATPTRKDTPARATTYSYDHVGNRLSVTDTAGLTPVSYSTNALNQYTNVDGAVLGYDGNGNLTSRAGWSYAYDAQNRLVSAQSATSSVTFAYDARNRCVQRTVDGAAMYLVYDGWTLLEERTAAGSLVARYVHGLGADEPLAMIRADGQTLFYHQDGLGNVSAITDGAGQLVERYLYDVSGAATMLDANGALVTGSMVGNRFLYTGREWIAEAGLYDYRNRVYSALLGRFFQSDPIRFNGGDVNIYRYCGNNGVNYADPEGLVGGATVPTGNGWVNVWTGQSGRYTGKSIIPTREEHANRNQYNWVPSKEPKNDPEWQRDSWGAGKYRNSNGSEAAYDKNGDLIPNKGTYNFGPNPFTVDHVCKDFIPDFLYGGDAAYTPDITHVYPPSDQGIHARSMNADAGRGANSTRCSK